VKQPGFVQSQREFSIRVKTQKSQKSAGHSCLPSESTGKNEKCFNSIFQFIKGGYLKAPGA